MGSGGEGVWCFKVGWVKKIKTKRGKVQEKRTVEIIGVKPFSLVS